MALMGGVAADIRKNMGTLKEKVLEKLAAASVPADALENARHFIESVIRDMTVAAHGLTKDALLHIRTYLSDFLPSLSPNISRMRESSTTDGAEEEIHHHGQNKRDGSSKYMSPTTSLFSSLVNPISRL